MKALVVRNLKKTYKSKKRIVEAVKGISFEADIGEVFALLGPNGAGKSTTIKSILGLVEPDEGEIEVMGMDARRKRREALRYLSAVLEGNRNVHWRLTVEENLLYFGGIRGLGGKELKSRIEKVTRMLGLEDKMKQLAGKLSRGYQQRLAIAIALLPDTPIVLLDEPTLGLDVESSLEIRRVIKELASEGKLVLLSTHDMKLVEETADRVMVINDGKVVVMDEKERLKGMFRSRSYRFVFERVSEKLLEKLKEYGKIETENGKVVVRFDFTSPDGIYDLFEILMSEKPEISSIVAEEPDFEEIFVRIIRGDGR